MLLSRHSTRAIANLAMASGLAGCTVGPDYVHPPIVATSAESGAPFRRIGDLPTAPLTTDPRWWQAFGDQLLDQLIAQALESSPSIAIAEARLGRSRGMLRQQEANLLPQVGASATYLRYRLPLPDVSDAISASADPTTIPKIPNKIDGGLWSGGFDATWEIDLFGGKRRQRDASRAQAEAAEAQLADAQISLAAEVAQAYIDLREQQQRVILSNRATILDRQSLALTEQQFRQGAASREDLERLRAQLAQTRSQELPLAAQVEQSLNRLAVLIGREPGFVDADLVKPAPVPRPPARLPVDDPASMLRRRPDIRAAERQIAASTAQIGVSEAARFPTVSLLGMIGLGGPSLGDLSVKDFTAIGTPMLRWNFLDFGRARSQVRQAEAQRDEALEQYRQTVLQALQDAENSLAQFRGQRGALASRIEGQRAAATAAEMVRQRREQGAASTIDLLDSQRQRNNADQQLAQAYAKIANGYVAVAKSMGIGWSALRTGKTSSPTATGNPSGDL